MTGLSGGAEGYSHFSLCGAILAGGRSSRMGAPKAFMQFPSGESLLDRSLYLLWEMRLPRVVVGQPRSVRFPRGIPLILDPLPDRGPMGGLLGLLESGLASHYLVLACDQPLLNASLLATLMEKLDNRPTAFAGEPEIYPLPGLYPASLLPLVKSQLSDDRASLKFLLQSANARLLQLPVSERRNLRGANTPQEFAELAAEFMNRPSDFKKVL